MKTQLTSNQDVVVAAPTDIQTEKEMYRYRNYIF